MVLSGDIICRQWVMNPPPSDQDPMAWAAAGVTKKKLALYKAIRQGYC